MINNDFKTFLFTNFENKTNEQITAFLQDHADEIFPIYHNLVAISQTESTISLAESEFTQTVTTQLIDKVVTCAEEVLNKSRKSLLFNEIDAGNLDQIKRLISKGFNPNILNENGQTPLAAALIAGHPEIALYLMERTTNIRATSSTGDSYLHLALRYLPENEDSTRVIHQLCELGVDLGWQNDAGQTPLMLAAQEGLARHLSVLLQHSPDTEIADSNGTTALMLACEAGHVDAAQELVNGKANVNARDRSEKTPLMFACVKRKLDIVELLTNNGATIDAKDANGHTPLLLAAEQHSGSFVNHLIDLGAADHLTEGQADFIMRRMCLAGDTAAIEKLADKGYAFDKVDEEGTRPVLIACENGCCHTALYLLQQGASLDMPDHHGQTALIKAIMSGSEDTVKMLLTGDPDINHADGNGYTPLHYCYMSTDSVNTAPLLIQKGADFSTFLDSLPLPEDKKENYKRIYENDPRDINYEIHQALTQAAYAMARNRLRTFLTSPIQAKTQELCDIISKFETITDFSEYQYRKPEAFKKILNNRMLGSATLFDTMISSTELSEKRQNWMKADDLVRNWAIHHTPLSKDTIAEVNLLIADKGGGIYRTLGHEVNAGGAQASTYLLGEYVDEEMNLYMDWLNENLEKCDKNELNPIELAARAEQYLISIHPFNDANGRTARMVMDYVLQRYGLPPACLGKEMTAAFLFSTKSVTPDQVVSIVAKGVKESYQLLIPKELEGRKRNVNLTKSR